MKVGNILELTKQVKRLPKIVGHVDQRTMVEIFHILEIIWNIMVVAAKEKIGFFS